MRRIGVVVALWGLAGAGLAANVWNTKAFTAWTDKDVERVMSDSPWAGRASLTHGRAGANLGPVPEWKVTVTWRSALPIKQGIVRQEIGQGGVVPPDLQSVLATDEAFYVIGVDGLPSGFAVGLENIAKVTTLTRNGKAPIVPQAYTSVLFDADGQPMEPPARGRGGAGRGGPGGPGGGFGGFGGGFGGGGRQPTAMLIFLFPRTDAVVMADRDVEFATVIGTYNVKRRFRLRDMTVNGQLAL